MALQKTKNGTLIRQIINRINEIDFTTSKDLHTSGTYGTYTRKSLKTCKAQAMQASFTPGEL
ncbi:MAG: hypothetical protein WB014_06600 [Methanosarcina sp.]